MSSNFKDLQGKWESSKLNIELPPTDFNAFYKKIKEKENENYFFYYGTITILFITLLVLTLFFIYVAPVQEILSRIGAGFMILGLVFRIFIEILSIKKAKQINNLDTTLTTAENSIKFHLFRKTIHGVIAPIIIGLYTVGFYMITPEFSMYIEFWNLVLIDMSYVVVGIILFIVIRKGVKKEMQKLRDIVKLKNEITN